LKRRGQQIAVVLVYLLLGSIVFAALTPGLNETIALVLPSVDTLTALMLRWFVGLAFIVMLYGVWQSTKPFQGQQVQTQ
jgi:hypothetical protein